MGLADFSVWEYVAMVGAIAASGLMRGFTGGAGANFFSAPVLAVILGPREAVPIILMLNFLSAFTLVPAALPNVNWREAIPMGIAAAVALPLGAWLLFTIDENLMRRAVAGTAVLFSLLMLSGWRYRGRRSLALSAAVGASAGTISGAVSLGGPPVFLYLLSGPDGAVSNRATFLAFGTALQMIAVIVFFASGAISERMIWLSAIFIVPFLGAAQIGTALFRRTDEVLFRRISLGCMAVIAAIILVA